MIEKKILEDQAIRRCDLIIRGFTTFENMREFAEICKQALEENQQYRELGTVEDYWKLNEMCKEYSAIGTIDEFKALKEKIEKVEFILNEKKYPNSEECDYGNYDICDNALRIKDIEKIING